MQNIPKFLKSAPYVGFGLRIPVKVEHIIYKNDPLMSKHYLTVAK